MYSLSFMRRTTGRVGVTILEVLFAIGLVIIGILGIASVLPLAGRQAGDSNRAAISQALGESWYREFMVRGMHQSTSWWWFNDMSNNGIPLSYNPYLKSLSVPVSSTASTTSPANWRPVGKQGICIDPVFFTDRDFLPAVTIGFTTSWYRPIVFPYFQESYNPTIDPAYPASPSFAWEDQPRLLRVTVATGGSLINSKMVEQMFQSQDDLVFSADEKELDLAPVRGIQFYTDPTTSSIVPFARAQAKSEYSWIATLTPTEQSDSSIETHYTLSLVVIHRREVVFFDPSVSATRVPGTLAAPDEKPQGERLVWVLPLSGNFDGGHGGRVQLIGTDGIKDDVQIGDWMMLSRHVSASVTSAPSQQRYSVFRWYRVVGVDEQATYGPMTGPDPYGKLSPDEVWTREVVLEGPDWNFSPIASVQLPVGTTTMIAPTTATIVKGATHVIERVVEIP